MDSIEQFLKLVKDFAKDGKITSVEKIILAKKAAELGIDSSSLETIIEMELLNDSNSVTPDKDSLPSERKVINGTYGAVNKTDSTFEIWDSDPGDPIEFKWVDEEQRKLEIKIGTVSPKIELITELEFINLKDQVYFITTKDIILILKYYDGECALSWANEIRKEMNDFFGEIVGGENLEKKLEIEKQNKIVEKKREGRGKQNEERVETEDSVVNEDDEYNFEKNDSNYEEEQKKERDKEEIKRQLREEIFKLRDKARQSLDSAKDDLANAQSGSYNDKHVFTSSITRGGDVMNPDIIIIEAGKVIWKKGMRY
ncbi:hypothetical protein [Candidatus Pollutiaquabacter sp.]|uniref:hypothetical protein n=1 Tax=Candidatus Pollutiaquabacter sp. TaxID=3416354 RepID=UPI003C86AD3E|nr:hypothetical protein [Bacteroidota bacterium]